MSHLLNDAIQCDGATDTGRIRQNNEDVFVRLPLWEEQALLAVVIDGMGGYEGGEVAARIAADSIVDYLTKSSHIDSGQSLKEAFIFANNAIYAERISHPQYEQMACVATALLVVPEESLVYMAHVGDTRCYRLFEGELHKMSHDHSPVGQYEDQNMISEEKAMAHPMRNVVERCLGEQHKEQDVEDFVEQVTFSLLPNSIWMLCSDGLTDMVNARGIQEILMKDVSPADLAHSLVDAANAAGGKDNVTVVVLRVNAAVDKNSFASSSLLNSDASIEEHAEGKPKLDNRQLNSDCMLSMPSDELNAEHDTLKDEHVTNIPHIDDSMQNEEEPECDLKPQMRTSINWKSRGLWKTLVVVSVIVLVYIVGYCSGIVVREGAMPNQHLLPEPVKAESDADFVQPAWLESLADSLEKHINDVHLTHSFETEMEWMVNYRDNFVKQVDINHPELRDSDFVVKTDYVYKKLLFTRYRHYLDKDMRFLIPWKRFIQYADWLTVLDCCRIVGSKQLLQDEMRAWETLQNHLKQYFDMQKLIRLDNMKMETSEEIGNSLRTEIDSLVAPQMINLLSARSLLLRNDFKVLKGKQNEDFVNDTDNTLEWWLKDFGKYYQSQSNFPQNGLSETANQYHRMNDFVVLIQKDVKTWFAIREKWLQSVASEEEMAFYQSHTKFFLKFMLMVAKEDNEI